MKTNAMFRFSLAIILYCLIGSGFISVSQAQTPSFTVAQFDTGPATGFLYEYGAPVPTYLWDTNNALTVLGANNPGSGSVQVSLAWSGTGQQVQFDYPFGTTLNLNNYTNISFDIMFDTNCATDGFGSYGNLIVTFYATAQGYSADAIGTYNSLVANGNNWIHVALPINPNGNPDYNAAQRMGFKVQQARTGHNIVGTSLFHVDNIILGGNATPPPPPTMSIKSAGSLPPGLLMIPGEVAGDYTRQLITAKDTSYSWIGSTAPVTYSTTITNSPGTNNPGFQSVIFMVPPGTLGDPAVDYDAANVAQLVVVNNADGTATGSFQFKTNQPTGNSQFGGTGNLANLTASTVLGTWSITFNNDTNFTLTGPGGVSTNANFPDLATAQVFANPMRIYFGCDQGGAANKEVGAIYSEFKISGVTASPPIDDTFPGAALDTATNWTMVAAAPANVFVIPALTGNQYWVNWTLPALNFGLQTASNLANGMAGFQDPGVQHTVGTSTRYSVLTPGMTTNVPSGSPAFFNLIKRTFSQLQVLLPGETNAPGTLTGKIGTPTPVSLSATSGFENVTVNAVDSTFHIINSVTDVIAITTTDGNAFTPNNTPLVNGTATIAGLVFVDQGSFTVTATDVTNGGISPATSSPVTVGP